MMDTSMKHIPDEEMGSYLYSRSCLCLFPMLFLIFPKVTPLDF